MWKKLDVFEFSFIINKLFSMSVSSVIICLLSSCTGTSKIIISINTY